MPATATATAFDDAQTEPDRTAESGATRRPRLLLAAARLGRSDYRRHRDLPRLIGPDAQPSAVIDQLTNIETRLEEARRRDDPTWSCLRHVEVLIALLAERAMRLE